MKKLILSLTLAGAAALAAKATPVSSANTFGVLKVSSSTKDTIIAVPWVEVGANESDVKVANLVMTSNLTARDTTTAAAPGSGDMLYYYNGSTYDAWELTQAGSEAAKVWTSVQNVTANGITSSGNSQDVSLPRGKALIIVRNNTDSPIYLYGQYATGVATTTITPNAWNLLAPSSATDTPVTSAIMEGTPNANDYIMLSNEPAKQYKYADGKWSYSVKKLNGDVVKTDLTIPAGTGAWYISAGGSPTFNW